MKIFPNESQIAVHVEDVPNEDDELGRKTDCEEETNNNYGDENGRSTCGNEEEKYMMYHDIYDDKGNWIAVHAVDCRLVTNAATSGSKKRTR